MKRITFWILLFLLPSTVTSAQQTTKSDIQFWTISALIGLLLAVIVLPQLLGYFQEKRASADFQKRIDELERRLEQHQQEIEALKSEGL
ncbi:MAG: hypothetical protein H8D67_05050 [Deltaproteobacteria bacterium]|nr:hypothetical protein [Deltaproteobacteria bacterium]